jgi:UPF0042 nucleotide-binding protein
VRPALRILSFGYRHRDQPPAAAALIDIRWLPSPTEVAALQGRSGRDRAVQKWLLGEHGVEDWCDRLLDALVPQLIAVGLPPSDTPPEVTWAFGSERGHDRSVVVAERMAEVIHRSTHLVAVVDHLDINRGGG